MSRKMTKEGFVVQERRFGTGGRGGGRGMKVFRAEWGSMGNAGLTVT